MAGAAEGRFEIGQVITNIGRILRGGWQPIWPVLLITMLAPPVVLAVIQLGLGVGAGSTQTTLNGLPNTSFFGGANAAFGVIAVVGVIVVAVISFAGVICANYAGVNFLDGKSTTSREALTRAGQVYLPVFGMGILVGLGVGAGFLLFIVPGLFLAVAWSVANPVRIMEKIHAVDAIGRSFRLTTNFRWPIFGVYLILICIYFGLALLVGVVSVILRLVGLGVVGALVFTPLLQAVVGMGAAAATASIYHELIRIKEGGGATVADVFS
jgi:hypothetical protein